MHIDRLLELLHQWKIYMHSDNHKLGYPNKSIGLSSGGASTSETFDEMIEIVDKDNVMILDTVIHNLPKKQRDSIYYRYLGGQKPSLYEMHLNNAMDNLLTIVGHKIEI